MYEAVHEGKSTHFLVAFEQTRRRRFLSLREVLGCSASNFKGPKGFRVPYLAEKHVTKHRAS